jgi:hypothetical protein
MSSENLHELVVICTLFLSSQIENISKKQIRKFFRLSLIIVEITFLISNNFATIFIKFLETPKRSLGSVAKRRVTLRCWKFKLGIEMTYKPSIDHSIKFY